MGVDVWSGGREVARKVSLCHLFLPTQAEKPDTAPKTQLVQMPAFLNRSWSSKAQVSLHLPLNQPGEVCCITPIPTPQGSVWKVGPKPKHETDEIFPW